MEINPNCEYVNTYTFRTLWCPPFVLTAYCLVFLWYMINPTRLIIYENCLVVLGRVAKKILIKIKGALNYYFKTIGYVLFQNKSYELSYLKKVLYKLVLARR